MYTGSNDQITKSDSPGLGFRPTQHSTPGALVVLRVPTCIRVEAAICDPQRAT